jgi:hypothetical protein
MRELFQAIPLTLGLRPFRPGRGGTVRVQMTDQDVILRQPARGWPVWSKVTASSDQATSPYRPSTATSCSACRRSPAPAAYTTCPGGEITTTILTSGVSRSRPTSVLWPKRSARGFCRGGEHRSIPFWRKVRDSNPRRCDPGRRFRDGRITDSANLPHRDPRLHGSAGPYVPPQGFEP